MSLVFINYPLETFTPSSSGALSTIIWECCRLTERDRHQPYVITRSAEAEQFPWANKVCIDPPYVPNNRLAQKLFRVERKFTGWRHLRHRAYASRVASRLREMKLDKLPLVLMNDPEMAIFLRHRFPNAFIMHWFQNQLECSQRVQQQFAGSPNVVAGVSNFTSRWIGSHYQLEEVHTIYNGVDVEQFSPDFEQRHEVPVVNFVGRTGIEKAPDLLLRSALALAQKTKNFSIQMIGSNHWDHFEMDAYQMQLQDLVDELLSKGIVVRRPGHIGRYALPSELRKADIHVVPSRWDEPCALTNLEGMASGLATVASATGGTPEVVGEAGFLFERDSVDGLADHLEKLVMDPSLRREYARRARDRAKEFPWDRTWNSLKTLAGV